jgi:indole-3-glycerol phosphate synthase
MTVLDKIIKYKRKEVAEAAAMKPVSELGKTWYYKRDTISLSEFLIDRKRTGIIAEFKRQSPSRGIINENASVAEVTSGYFREGASAVSVLTDTHFFGGSSDDLLIARENAAFPILRKDFIIDEYQVIESKAIGADAILLIAAALNIADTLKLSRLARVIGLEVVLEIHDQGELDHLNEFVNIVGVNNRNLKTFRVNTKVSATLAGMIPESCVKISESGIASAREIAKLTSIGYQGFLIGEKFMNSPDPVKAFAEFVMKLDL